MKKKLEKDDDDVEEEEGEQKDEEGEEKEEDKAGTKAECYTRQANKRRRRSWEQV